MTIHENARDIFEVGAAAEYDPAVYCGGPLAHKIRLLEWIHAL